MNHDTDAAVNTTIDITHVIHDGYVHCRCTGVYEYDSAMHSFSYSLELAHQHRLRAALIDIRDVQTGNKPPDTNERYNIGNYIATHNPNGIFYAIVGNEPLIDPERFGETVSLNRGAIGRVFTDPDQALAWLLAIISRT